MAAKKRSSVKGGAYSPKTGAFAGREFPTRRQYENALATLRGFANASQRRAASRSKSTALTAAELRTRERVQAAVRTARIQKVPLTKAARQHRTTTAAIRRYAGENVARQGRRLVLRPHITFFAANPPRIVHDHVADAGQRATIGAYMSYVGQFLSPRCARAAAALKAFDGFMVNGALGRYELLTNLDELRRLPLSDLETTEGIYLDLAG